jgi:hypothetical protein
VVDLELVGVVFDDADFVSAAFEIGDDFLQQGGLSRPRFGDEGYGFAAHGLFS